MAQITKVDKIESEFKGKKKTSYKFTLDDGKVGYASNDKVWEFKEGDPVSYTVEIKKSSKGEYNLFTFTRAGEQPSAPPAQQPKPQEQKTNFGNNDLLRFKVDLRIAVLRTIGEVAAAGRIEPKEMVDYYNTFYPAADASIDELKG